MQERFCNRKSRVGREISLSSTGLSPPILQKLSTKNRNRKRGDSSLTPSTKRELLKDGDKIYFVKTFVSRLSSPSHESIVLSGKHASWPPRSNGSRWTLLRCSALDPPGDGSEHLNGSINLPGWEHMSKLLCYFVGRRNSYPPNGSRRGSLSSIC